MRLKPDTIWKEGDPFYGIPESGLHWYLTYANHHDEQKSMLWATIYRCVLIQRDETYLNGLVSMQVDNCMAFGTSRFESEEESTSWKYKSKPRQLHTITPTTFSRSNIARSLEETITMAKTDKTGQLTDINAQIILQVNDPCRNILESTKMHDVKSRVQLLAAGNKATIVDKFVSLNQVIRYPRKRNETILTLQKVDLPYSRLGLLREASYVNASDIKHETGYISHMSYEHDTMNVFQYGSDRSRCVTRSVMASEIHTVVLGFEQSFLLQYLLEDTVRIIAEL